MTEEGRAGIHGRLLDHLLDGAMVVERGGTITVLNPAAARILGVSLEEVAEKTFAELFIAREGFEEFSDVILDAVAGEGRGRPEGGGARHRRCGADALGGDLLYPLERARRRRAGGADRRVQRHHRAPRAA